eukprot:9856540-Karenia_brevis.AAC.1
MLIPLHSPVCSSQINQQILPLSGGFPTPGIDRIHVLAEMVWNVLPYLPPSLIPIQSHLLKPVPSVSVFSYTLSPGFLKVSSHKHMHHSWSSAPLPKVTDDLSRPRIICPMAFGTFCFLRSFS